jgi:hypothetical protein
MQDKIQKLRLKKARLFSQIEMLAEVSDSMLRDFGKVCAEIMLLEKQFARETKNIFDED